MQRRRALPLVLLGAGVVALLGPGCVLVARAQHGGGHAAPAMPASRGGFAPASHPGGPGGPSPIGRSGSITTGHAPPSASFNGRGATATRSFFPPPGVTSTRPVFYSNGIRRYGESERRGRQEYGSVGFVALGYPGVYPGYGFDYDPEFLEPTENPNTAPGSYGSSGFGSGSYGYMSAPDAFPEQQPGPPEAEQSGADFTGQQTYPAPAPYATAPESARPSAIVAAKAAPLPEEEPVTIIFKDGRPPEKIHNYALTRTTLYITTDRVRTVPLDQVDLAATEKANQQAGVEFELPSKP